MPPKVAPIDLGALHQDIRHELQAAFERVLGSGWFVLGPEVEKFEHAFAVYCGAAHCVGVASGLDALKLAFAALGIGHGDEVIVPSHAYQATWLAVVSVGARPVPVEPAKGSYLIDPDRIADAITSRTRAIAPIHLYGEPCNMTAICAVARDAGLFVVEDAAQAHGAKWQGQRIGAHGDAVCWSFYPTKNLGALGDGGAVTTNNPDVAKRIESLRNYGLDPHKTLAHEGLNSRLDDLQAALLSVKLEHLDAWNAAKQRTAALYHALLVEEAVTLPIAPPDATHVWHQYVVQLEDRDRIRSALAEDSILTDVHYPVPVAAHPLFSELDYASTSLPMASSLSSRILSLPISPKLSDADVRRVARSLAAAL